MGHGRNAFTWEAMCQWTVPTFTSGVHESSRAESHDIPEVSTQQDSATDSSSDSTSDSASDIEPDDVEWFRQGKGGKFHILQKLAGSALIHGAALVLSRSTIQARRRYRGGA